MDKSIETKESSEVVIENSELRPLDFEGNIQDSDIPESFSSINNDIKVAEGGKLDYFIDQIKSASESIKWKTGERFVLLGSAGMYAYIQEIREGEGTLPIIEKRIGGGKNDFDVGVAGDKISKTMAEFGWSEVDIEKQRGYIEGGKEKIDLMSRQELPSFPWQKHEIKGQEVYTLSPEEMIFEKMNALMSHGADRKGENPGEVKWGFDIQILKSCLMKASDWDEKTLEEHLSKYWERYEEEKRYGEIPSFIERFKQDGSAREAMRGILLEKGILEGKDDDIEGKMLDFFGREKEVIILDLLSSKDESEFEVAIKNLIDGWLGSKKTYEEASQVASQRYKGLKLTA